MVVFCTPSPGSVVTQGGAVVVMVDDAGTGGASANGGMDEKVYFCKLSTYLLDYGYERKRIRRSQLALCLWYDVADSRKSE